MSDYKKLIKTVDKEVISLKELQAIMADDLVAEVKEAKRDDRHKNYPRYDVRLTNGESYFVYVKKSLFDF